MKPALAFVAPHPVALPPRQVSSPLQAPLQPQLRARSGDGGFAVSPRGRGRVLLAIAGLHVLGLWGLSRMQDVHQTITRMAPIVVRLIAPAEPPKPVPPQPVALPEFKLPPTTLIEPPVIAIAAAPAPAPVVAALPPPPPAPVAVQTAPAPVVQVVQPPAPPAIKRLPASAVRWLKEPRMTVPLMSKRLRESGVVQVRVVVDVNGLPREVSLARSSGFARLDEQALLDIRTARFVPYTENGQPVELEVIAPMSYEVDR